MSKSGCTTVLVDGPSTPNFRRQPSTSRMAAHPVTGVPIPKFAKSGGTLSGELRDRKDTSKYEVQCGLDLRFLRGECRNNGRNFKSTTLGSGHIDAQSSMGGVNHTIQRPVSMAQGSLVRFRVQGGRSTLA